MKDTQKIFEVLSQKIRFDIVTQLEVSRKPFSELLACFEGIRSNTFSFHIKKLVDSNLVRKRENNYELTEFGLTTLKFIEAYESDQKDYYHTYKVEEGIISPITTKYPDFTSTITLPSRPEGLPPSIRTFELFQGKNSSFMTKNFFLPLPEPINKSLHPQSWIENFYKEINSLSKNEQAKEWLEDRLLKLAYGTRGLQDFGLMDASLSVPPLESTLNHLLETLLNRGKAGLFATTGMGKSRIMLYLASLWIRSFQTQVLFIDNPREMKDSEWNTLYEILSSNLPKNREDPHWLVIIEDVHLVSLKTLNTIKKLIADAGTQSWSILIAFTNSVIQYQSQLNLSSHEFITSIEQLRLELQPLEISLYFDLNTIWPDWRPYFSEWIKWTALDVLVNLVPWTERVYESQSLKEYESPWAMVVSLGFLKAALMNFQKSVTENFFPLLLYSLISFLYVLRGEKNVTQSYLLSFLQKTLEEELSELYPNMKWEEEVQALIINWTNPLIRLLPPIKYKSSSGSLKKEIEISFYHQEWAREVCKILLSQQTEDVHNMVFKVFKSQIPTVYTIWIKIAHTDPKFKEDFLNWLRENTRFELNNEGQLVLVHLKLDPNQIQHLDESSLVLDKIDQLNQIQLLNWTFIKKVVSNYQTFT